MMVNCPKCGFSQPRDQYCARCGVDMLAYKPAEIPLARRVLGSTLFQAITLVVVVAVILFTVRQQRRRELAERVAEIENAKNTELISRRAVAPASEPTEERGELAAASTTPPPSAAPDETTSTEITAAPAESVAAPGSASGASVPAATTASLAPSASPSPAGAAAATADAGGQPAGRAAKNLRVVFAEVQRTVLADLVASADSRLPVSSGPVMFGVVPNMQNKLRAAQSDGRLKIVDSNQRSMEPGQAASLTSLQRDETSGQMFGFDVEANATALNENESQLQLRLLRYMRDPNGQPEEFSVPMPEAVTIPRGAGAFIAGVLPRRISDTDRRSYEAFKVLHILSTEEYRAGVTDLVILIEPR